MKCSLSVGHNLLLYLTLILFGFPSTCQCLDDGDHAPVLSPQKSKTSTSTLSSITTTTTKSSKPKPPSILNTIDGDAVDVPIIAVPPATGLFATTTDSTEAHTHIATPTIIVKPEITISTPKITTSSLSSTSSSTPPKPPQTSTLSSSSKGVLPPAPDVVGGALPTNTAALAKPIVIGTIASLTITAIAGSSSVVVGSQTATIGGPELTLDNHFIVTAAPKGLVVYMPGGGVGSLAWPTIGADGKGPHDATHTSVGIGSIIAGIIGVSSPATATPTVSSTSPSSSIKTVLTDYTTFLSITTGSSSIPVAGTSTLPHPSSNSSSTSPSTDTSTAISFDTTSSLAPNTVSSLESATSTAAESGLTTSTVPVGNGAGERHIALSRLAIVVVASSVWWLFVS